MAQYNLIIQTAFVGDLVLSIPLIKNVKRLYPGVPLVLLCRQGVGKFFLDKKLADEVFEVGKKPASKWKEIKESLSHRKYKYVISPHKSLRTAYFVHGLNAENKIGYKSWWNFWVFHKRVTRPMYWPEVLRQMELIRHLDSKIDDELNLAKKFLWFDPEGSPKIPEIFSLQVEPALPQKEKIIFLSPGSEWPTKRWSPEGFVALGRYYQEKGYRVIITGTPAEVDLNAKIAALIPQSEDITGKTNVTELYEKFRKGTLLVSNDNGASHIASCAGLPTVAAFGPTVPAFGYRPWQDKSRIAQVELSCRPCSVHGQQNCPLGTHDCMKKLTWTHVRDRAEGLLS